MAKWDVMVAATGEVRSDVDEADVKRMVASGELVGEDRLRRGGDGRWRRVAELKGGGKPAAAPAVAAPAPAAPTEPVVAARPAHTEAVAEWDRVPAKTVVAPPSRKGPPARKPDEEEEPLAFVGKRIEIEPLDMTPMVDVVLLLLMFFMVTSAYSMQKTIEIPAPNPEKTQRRPETDPLKEFVKCEVDHQNRVFIENELVQPGLFVETIRAVRDEKEKKKMAIIAEGDSTNETTVRLMDAGSEAQMEQILFQIKVDD